MEARAEIVKLPSSQGRRLPWMTDQSRLFKTLEGLQDTRGCFKFDFGELGKCRVPERNEKNFQLLCDLLALFGQPQAVRATVISIALPLYQTLSFELIDEAYQGRAFNANLIGDINLSDTVAQTGNGNQRRSCRLRNAA